MTSQIIVVGAGVVGLTCAILAAENGYKVTVIASNFPSDPLDCNYTSPFAGAHFRPFPSKSKTEEREMYLTRRTQKYFEKLASKESESSIRFVDGIEYFEDPDEYYQKIGYGYSENIKGFKIIPKEDLPDGVSMGTSYKTWVLNPPLYLNYLERKLKMNYGVHFLKIRLTSLKEVFDMFPEGIVVNASGRGLQYNGSYDPKVYSVRGQTLLLRTPLDCPYLNKTVTHQSKHGLWTFVIPRPSYGGVILGGTKQVGDGYPKPRDKDTDELMARGKVLYPELLVNGKFDIRKINVAFRPTRVGGVRTETESIDHHLIVHAYGAGGMGYELSYGIAEKVLEYINEIHHKSKL